MNQKGWTNYGMLASDSTKIKNAITLGAKYLLLYDDETAKKVNIKPFTKNKISSYKHIDIYKL